MTKVLPPAEFAAVRLRLHEVPAGQTFDRIYLGHYPDPLGFGKTPSRFSDPRRRLASNRFGVLYLGDTVKVCFLEAVLPRLDAGRDVQVSIGDEIPAAYLRRFDVVDSTYGVDCEITGVQGVVGPTRMAYGRSISSVRYMARLMSDLMAELHSA